MQQSYQHWQSGSALFEGAALIGFLLYAVLCMVGFFSFNKNALKNLKPG